LRAFTQADGLPSVNLEEPTSAPRTIGDEEYVPAIRDTKMVVTLIGYRGTGKTTIARPLADRLGFDAIDSDCEIERRAARSIRQIFSEQGEPAFRALERTVMEELLSRDRLVIAAGGGAILDPTIAARMRAAGPVVWLTASVEAIERRMTGDPSTQERRPDLTPIGGRGEIEEVLARRVPLYRACATVQVDTEGRTIDEVVERILAGIAPGSQGGGRS
jgi:shikimate kinase